MNKRNIAFGSFDDDDEIVVKHAPRRMGEWKECEPEDGADKAPVGGGSVFGNGGAMVGGNGSKRLGEGGSAIGSGGSALGNGGNGNAIGSGGGSVPKVVEVEADSESGEVEALNSGGDGNVHGFGNGFDDHSGNDPDSVPEGGDSLPDLSGESGFEQRPPNLTREEALKYEINGFAKERPEDVAALIKSFLRGEN